MNTKPIAHVLVVAAVTAASACYAAGPVGLGDLKLGMTRSQVEALKGPVMLSSGLTDTSSEYRLSPNQVKLEGALANPVTGEVKATLYFTDGKLSMLYLSLAGEEQQKKALNLISAKYGSPEINDETSEVQCIYGNGANFKVKKGFYRLSWIQKTKSNNIQTSILILHGGSCPSNLRYALPSIIIRSLSIRYASDTAPSANPF